MPSHVSRPESSTPIKKRLALTSLASPSAPAPMEFDKPEMKPAGPVVKNYNPRPSGFTRFFERGLNQSGNRRDNRRGDFKFREGPFKGLTLGQAEERAFDLFNNLDPSVKAKYQRMADSKRGFDPRGGMSMGSGQTYNGRYLPNSRFNPNRFTDGAEKTELNDTELDFDNMPSNNNLAQNQSVSTEEAPPSGSPEPPASKPSGGLILNDENPSSAVSSPTMTPAPKNPFTAEQGDKKPAPNDRGTIDGMPTAQALSDSKGKVDAIRGSAGTKEESSKPATAKSSKPEKTYDLNPKLVELGDRLSKMESPTYKETMDRIRQREAQDRADIDVYNKTANNPNATQLIRDLNDERRRSYFRGEKLTDRAYEDQPLSERLKSSLSKRFKYEDDAVKQREKANKAYSSTSYGEPGYDQARRAKDRAQRKIDQIRTYEDGLPKGYVRDLNSFRANQRFEKPLAYYNSKY